MIKISSRAVSTRLELFPNESVVILLIVYTVYDEKFTAAVLVSRERPVGRPTTVASFPGLVGRDALRRSVILLVAMHTAMELICDH